MNFFRLRLDNDVGRLQDRPNGPTKFIHQLFALLGVYRDCVHNSVEFVCGHSSRRSKHSASRSHCSTVNSH